MVSGSVNRSTSVWSARLGLSAVLCVFCLPLFVGLNGWDLRNDEALYSHVIDRILETGDWLTPRLPGDLPFLEKPPLKFWIVAAAIRAGLLPNDEFGLRFFDALFSAVSFVYVFYTGRLLAGTLCGMVAVLILFTIDPLLFFHGLRENNMEAALVLAYCGGVYHFARWGEEGSRIRRSRHALAVGAYFTLGFMTKYVAVLFLPVVCAIAFMWREGALTRVRAQWREWIPAALFVLAATAPWFLYQAVHSGDLLWQTMFGQHVYVRFTAALDPTHLQPWHYYYSELWRELAFAGSLWIATIGLVMLTHKAWTGRPWLARLLLVWWIVPFALMSIGTSKMIHYAYPFLPPIALGAGLATDALVRAIQRGIAWGVRAAGARLPRRIYRRQAGVWPAAIRPVLVVGAAFALVLAVLTALTGQIRWQIGGVQLLQNSSVSRPLIISGVLFCLTGYVRAISAALAVAAVAVMLPLPAYPRTLERTMNVNRPLATLRDCMLRLDAPNAQTHVYPTRISHTYYYYLRPVGPWVEHHGSPNEDEWHRQLFVPGEQAIMILLRSDYERFTDPIDNPKSRPAGFALVEEEVVVMPTPFEACAVATVAAGAPGVGSLTGYRR